MNIPKELQHQFWLMAERVFSGSNIIEELDNFLNNLDDEEQEKFSIALKNQFRRSDKMKVHTDEKESMKKRIDKLKDDTARRNKELQRERQKKKK